MNPTRPLFKAFLTALFLFMGLSFLFPIGLAQVQDLFIFNPPKSHPMYDTIAFLQCIMSFGLFLELLAVFLGARVAAWWLAPRINPFWTRANLSSLIVLMFWGALFVFLQTRPTEVVYGELYGWPSGYYHAYHPQETAPRIYGLSSIYPDQLFKTGWVGLGLTLLIWSVVVFATQGRRALPILIKPNSIESPPWPISATRNLHSALPSMGQRIQGWLMLGFAVTVWEFVVFASDVTEAQSSLLRIDLPLPTQFILSAARSYAEYRLIYGIAMLFIYQFWISRDSRRISIFILVLWLLLLCGLPLLITLLITPFYGIQCIRRGSRVSTPAGPRKIEDLRVGDAVLCMSPDLEIVPGSITAVIPGAAQECFKLTLESGAQLFATSQHPIGTSTGWIKVEELRVGMEIRTVDATSKLIAIETNVATDTVFDLSVKPHPNFFAEGVLVHNKMRKK